MASIGGRLKEARIAKGLTIEELQQKTKIQKRYLEAIEQDNYEEMPGTYYVRNFIRQYAEAVNLDGEKLIRIYDGRSEVEIDDEEVQGSRQALHGAEGRSAMGKAQASLPLALLVVVVVAIVGVIIYVTWEQQAGNNMIDRSDTVEVDKSSQAKETKKETSKTTQSTEAATSETKEAASKMTMSVTSDDGRNVAMSVKNVENPAKLTFTGTNGTCWVGVMVNGAYVYEHTLQPGETVETSLPEGTAQTQIVLGASLNASIKINGEDLNYNSQNTQVYQRNVSLALEYKE